MMPALGQLFSYFRFGGCTIFDPHSHYDYILPILIRKIWLNHFSLFCFFLLPLTQIFNRHHFWTKIGFYSEINYNKLVLFRKKKMTYIFFSSRQPATFFWDIKLIFIVVTCHIFLWLVFFWSVNKIHLVSKFQKSNGQ